MISLSDNMCSARMSRRKIYINLLAVAASLNKINITSLVNLSTIIIIKSNTTFIINSFDGGSLTIKFIDIELHGLPSTYNGYNNLYSLCLGIFIL